MPSASAPEPKVRTGMTPEAVREFLEKIRGHRLVAPYSVAMAVGLRQSEALGLLWNNVDIDRGFIHVRTQLDRVDGEYVLREPKRSTSWASGIWRVTTCATL